MKKFNPLVSIIIPVYNGSNFLESAINSALSQSYKNIEIIIINDGSNDNLATEKIAKKFEGKIRYFFQENGGCGSALNLGIEHMKGEYFSWLSHDDLYLPNKIQLQIDCLKNLADKNTIIFGAYELVDENLEHKAYIFPDKELPSEKLKLPLMPLLRGLIHGCTLLIPKKRFDEIGVFDISKRTTQDYALWFDFFRQTPLEYIDQPLIKSRIHAAQDTQKMNALHLAECNDLWGGFLERLSLEEMKLLDGSRFSYLVNMADHLSKTPYTLALQKARQIVSNLIQNTPVAIILSTYGATRELISSFNSILAQSHKNIEILVLCKDSIEIPIFNDSTFGKLSSEWKFFSDEFSKNNIIREFINNTRGQFIAFLEAGDTFTEEKIYEQVKFMLIHDAEISVTSIVSPNKAPKTVSSKIEFNFLHNGFPTIIFKLDQYLSTLMMSTNAVQLFTTISYRDAEDGKPVWIKAFALHRVRYLNKVLTNIGEHPIINLSTLQNTY